MFFKAIPLLGTKTNVPLDDPSLIKMIGNNVGVCADTGGQNVDFERKANSCTRSYGWTQWSNSITSTSRCDALFELYDGTNRDNINITNGIFYYYDATPDPVAVYDAKITYSNFASGPAAAGETVTGDTTSTQATLVTGVSAASGTLYITDVTGGTGDFSASESLTFSGGASADCDSVIQNTTWNKTLGEPYSFIKYGSYLVFADYGDTTPQKWMNGDSRVTNLITGTNATLYKFRYLIEWYNHIIGLYSDQTTGYLDIRWTDVLPAMTNLTFPAANQLYKPGTDHITGVAKFGANNVLIYGEDSICKMDYYPGSTPVFGLTTLVDGQGCACNSSLINAYGSNWFFNKNYGFVKYSGGHTIREEDVISRDIQDIVDNIDLRYVNSINGVALPGTRQVVWSIPQAAAHLNSLFVRYDTQTGVWSKESKAFQKVSSWTQSAGEARKIVGASANGHVYAEGGDIATATSAVPPFEAYRIEPAMYFGDAKKKKTLNAIWLGIVEGGDYSIDVFHRTQETVKGIEDFKYISYSGLSGTISAGETVVGGTTSTNSTVVSAESGILRIKEITSAGTGDYQAGETLTFSGGASATCDSIVWKWQYFGSLNLSNPVDPVLYMPQYNFFVEYDNLAGGNFSIGQTATGQTGATTAEIVCVIKSSTTAGRLYFKEFSGGDGGFDDNEQLSNGIATTADCVGTSHAMTVMSTGRYHQIKWGTDEDSEKFSINWIEYEYEYAGNY